MLTMPRVHRGNVPPSRLEAAIADAISPPGGPSQLPSTKTSAMSLLR